MHIVWSSQIVENITFLIRHRISDVVQSRHINITYTGDRMTVVVYGMGGNDHIIAETDEVPAKMREFTFVISVLGAKVAEEVRAVLQEFRAST